MKKSFFIFISIAVLAMQGVVLNAQKEAAKTIPDFSTWSEKQIQQWEDSVKKALYPDLEIKTTKMSIEKSIPAAAAKIAAAYLLNNLYVPNSVSIDMTKAVGEIPVNSAY